jgi:hypothetical protein
VDLATGIWGIWMPGFMQFLTGVYLFLGLTLFGTFTASPPLYMAALAFTAYGVHWFALGWIRLRRADARANIGMTVAFLAISVLGIIVFFKAGGAVQLGPQLVPEVRPSRPRPPGQTALAVMLDARPRTRLVCQA